MTMFRAALVLGLLSAVGPFAIDMYLPAMPAIANDLRVDAATVQLTLTVYFIFFGIAQLFYGPWADQVGRKVPIYFGVGIFSVASIGCAWAPTLDWLVAFRALQGIGGAVLMVVPRAVIRDLYTGADATKLMAMVMLVISVSPMLAPLAGSGLIDSTGWRGIFGFLALAALLSLTLTYQALPETLQQKDRVRVNIGNLWHGTKTLLKDHVFMGLTFIGGFGFASFMIFIASAAFVYSGQYGLSATEFSLAFAFNAIGFFAASQSAGPLSAKYGTAKVIFMGVLGFAVFSSLLLAGTLSGLHTLEFIIAGLFCANAFLGLVLPTTMVMALDPHGEIAGLASSLGGTLQMVTGGIMTALTGLFFDGRAVPMVAAITLCAILSLIISIPTLRALQPVSKNPA